MESSAGGMSSLVTERTRPGQNNASVYVYEADARERCCCEAGCEALAESHGSELS